MATQQGDTISREKWIIIDRVLCHKRETRQVNLSSVLEESTDDLWLPMLRHSDSLSSLFSSDYSMVSKYKEEGYYKLMPKVCVDGLILQSHSDPRNPVTKSSRKIMSQRLIRTAASFTNRMVAKFTQKINDFRPNRVNQDRVKLD